MPISIAINGTVTLDESDALQTGGVAAPPEDNNDSDVSLATLQAGALSFYNRLFVTGPSGAPLSTTFATTNGVAQSATNYVSLSGTGSVISLGFTTATGSVLPVLGSGTGAACNLTAVDGGAITLFSDASLGSRVVYGVDTDGDIVFAMYLDPAANLLSARVWMVQFEAMSNPVTTNHDDPLLMTGLGVGAGVSTEFNFAGLPSGQNLFGMVGTTGSGIVVFGQSTALNADGTFTQASNTINTSQGGGSTTIGVNNQMFDPGEGAYFTYVRGADSNFLGFNLNSNEADDADNMLYSDGNGATNDTIESDGAFLRIAQLQGGGLATMRIDAYNINGSPQGRNLITASGQNAVEITRVKVYDSAGNLLDDSNNPAGNNAAISFDLTGLSAIVSGLNSGYKVEWFTNGVHDQVKITGVGGKFDIGGFGINEPTAVSAPLTGVRFEDDGPAVDLALNGTAELRLDETDNDADDLAVGGILATNSLTAAAYLTTNSASFGTDGEAGANPTVWSLSLTGANAAGVDSGLDDAVSNNNVMLFVVNSTTIVGRDGGAGGAVVMTISINATTGELTVVQNRAVEHNDPLDHDENGTSSAMMNSGLVAAVRTVTDGDGDSASDNVDVSQVIKLEDDGPAVDLALNGTAELRLDETDNDADDLAVGGILATNSLTAAAYLTTNSADFGTDGEAGANPTVWSLSLTGANAAGVDSGLDDAVSNNNVMLFVVNSTTIVGRDGGAGGAVVMTISINATTGELTVVQNRAVEHNDPLDHDENGTSSAMMNSGLVAAVRTVTDGDGDSASDNVDVSQVIKLEDDGPAVDLALNGTAELRLDETDNDADDLAVGGILATNSLTAAAYLTTNSADFGTDGEAGANPTVWSLSLTGANAAGVDSGLDDAVSNNNVMLFVVNSTTIVGRDGGAGGAVVMTISINATTGELTVVQNRAVEHNDPLDHDENGTSSAMMNSGLVAAVRTVTDGDGDSASDNVDVSQVIKLEDDGPAVDLVLNGDAEVTVDKSTLPASDSITAANLFSVNSESFGSDGQGAAGSVYKLLLADDNSGLLDTATGQEVLLTINAAGTLIIGSVNAGANEVFRIALNASTGEITLTQSRAMVHGDADDPDEADTPLTLPSELVRIQRTVTDGDGDSAGDNVDISQIFKFRDDGPVLNPPTEDVITLLTDDSDIADSAMLSTDIIFPDTPDFGSDGPNATDSLDFSLRLNPDAPNNNSGLIDTATGRAILLATVGADIVGYVDANGDGSLGAGETLEAIRYTLTADDIDSSTVTFSQSRSVIHANPNDPDEAGLPETIAANRVLLDQVAIDGDGDVSDVVSFDLGAITFIKDDGPTIGPISDGLVDFALNDSVTNPLNGLVGNDPNAAPYILTAFTPSLVVNGVTVTGVLSADETSVTYWANTNNNAVIGDAGDTAYYELELSDQGGDGDYTFTVLLNPPPAFLEFNFAGLPSGQNLFGMVGTTASGLIVIGKAPVLNPDGTFTNASNTINTSQGGGNTTIGVNNQMFDAGEGAYFTFIKNANSNFLGTNLSSNEADDADNMQYTDGNAATNDTIEATSAFLKIAQIQGGSLATMSIAAFNISGSPQGRDLITASGQNAVTVTKVKVFDAAGNLLEDSSLGGTQNASIVISFNAGVANVTGLNAGYKVEWFTNGVHDQVLINGVGGKFDIGGFGISQAQPTPDQMLAFTAQVTDGDGDTDTASWAIGIDGTGIHDDDAVTGVSPLAATTTAEALFSLKSDGAGHDALQLIGNSIDNDYWFG